MASRALFVGLGGTGGVALAFTRARLTARLRANGWTDGFPEQAWSFVHIDVPAKSDIGNRLDSAEAGDALALGATRFRGSEYQNLATNGVSYIDMDSAVVASTKFEALAGWRHRDPRMVNVPIEKGAGQYRSVGALVALATRGRISQGLQQAYNQLQGDQALAEAQQIAELLGTKSDTPDEPPQVFIVTSMIGGAGAGMVLEVASISRDLFGNFVSAFMVAPEGFDLAKVGQAAPANAWGLVSELQYLVAAGDGDHVPVAGERLSAPKTARGVYVLGRANADIRLTGNAAVEKVIGEGLASIVTTDEALHKVVNFAINHPVAKPDKLDLGESATFRSMGFGRLELGRDRFGRYVEDRLTGLIGERLSSLHVPRQTYADGTEERLVDAIDSRASSLRYVVAEQAGLHELDDEIGKNDQILNALAPKPFNSWSPGHLLQSLPSGDVKLADLIHQLKAWGQGRSRNDRSQWNEQLDENIQSWTRDVERRLFDATVGMIAEHGLPVAVATLGLIGEDLETAKGQLKSEANTKSELDLNGQIGEVVPAGLDGIATDDQRSRLAKITSGHLTTEFRALALEAAADACEQVSQHLVRPLRQALNDASKRVRDIDGEWTRQLAVLPTHGGVQAYSPDSFEVVIESVDTFDQQFGEQISATVSETRQETAISAAVTEVLVEFSERWISIEAGWRPGAIGGLQSVSETFRVSARVEPHQMMGAVRAWVDRPGYPIRSYLDAGLQSFVSQGPSELGKFRDALSRLIKVGSPLGHVDEGNVQKAHSTRTFGWAFSEFPFLRHEEALKSVHDALNDGGVWPPPEIELCEDRDWIEVLSFEGPYHALCFETIMAPIRGIWADATQMLKGERFDKKKNGVMSQFGSKRHAFPMSMTGPLSRTGQVELIRGYLVAVASGRFKDWSVYSEEMEDFVPLPKHAYPIDRDDYRDYKSTVGVLLEDIKVAYLEASADDLKPLKPYQALIQIGRASGDEVGRLSSDQRAHLQKLIDNVVEMVDNEREPRAVSHQRSSDLYELGDLLKQAVEVLSENLLGGSGPEAKF